MVSAQELREGASLRGCYSHRHWRDLGIVCVPDGIVQAVLQPRATLFVRELTGGKINIDVA